MMVSPVHIKEIEAIPDEIERIQLLNLLEKYGREVRVDLKEARKRAEELIKFSFGIKEDLK